MFKGTTPAINLYIDTDLSLTGMAQIWVTIKAETGDPVNWVKSDLLIDDTEKKITLTLSQLETLALASGKAQIQVRLLTNDNKALATNICYFCISDVLKGGVISA